MTTFRIPILGFSTTPDTSGNVFMEPLTIKATNDVWGHHVIVFNDTATRIGLHGLFAVPKNYVGSPTIVVLWSSTTNSGDVVWDFDYRAVGGNDAESLDQTSNQESVTVTDTAPTTAHNRLEASMSLTAANLAVDDSVQFTLFRDGTASDTMAAAAYVVGVYLQYSDV